MSAAFEVISTGTVGAEVKGVDLAAVSGAQIEAIKKAWYQHDVLIFRKQKMSDGDLLSFSRNFGALDSPPNGGRRAQVRSGISRNLRHLQRGRRQR